ncbi:MAG TPA: glycosyltransferase family 2 protein [Pirellulaceae bacterium]|nr:glycosyltransferase family 2 protein [Pirellulaceae bacterium]
MSNFLTALPVFNEARYVGHVLDQVTRFSDDVVVIDDGSSDGTATILRDRRDIRVVTHPQNRGYGAALKSAFEYAQQHHYTWLVTIDCDGQHEPQRIPDFVNAAEETGADIISGSRYLKTFDPTAEAPAGRKRINAQITQVLNARLKLNLTDAFCGFKAYRVAALSKLRITESGYAMPLELWVQAACAELKIVEVPVPLIYLDPGRSFGGNLDDDNARLQHYLEVIERSIAVLSNECSALG